MKHTRFLTVILTFVLAGLVITPVLAENSVQADLASARSATAKFHSVPIAMANDYNLVTGLENCFNNPGVGGMGIHLINMSEIDTDIVVEKPEALVYAPTQNEGLQLAAVEYIVPVPAWDATHAQPPELFGQSFEIDQELNLYELHAWIWQPNSLGMFYDWNPAVSCS